MNLLPRKPGSHFKGVPFHGHRFVYIYIHIHTCMFTCVYMYICLCMYTTVFWECVYAYTYIYIYVYTPSYFGCVYMYTYTPSHFGCVYVDIYVCVYRYICRYFSPPLPRPSWEPGPGWPGAGSQPSSRGLMSGRVADTFPIM